MPLRTFLSIAGTPCQSLAGGENGFKKSFKGKAARTWRSIHSQFINCREPQFTSKNSLTQYYTPKGQPLNHTRRRDSKQIKNQKNHRSQSNHRARKCEETITTNKKPNRRATKVRNKQGERGTEKPPLQCTAHPPVYFGESRSCSTCMK